MNKNDYDEATFCDAVSQQLDLCYDRLKKQMRDNNGLFLSHLLLPGLPPRVGILSIISQIVSDYQAGTRDASDTFTELLDNIVIYFTLANVGQEKPEMTDAQRELYKLDFFEAANDVLDSLYFLLKKKNQSYGAAVMRAPVLTPQLPPTVAVCVRVSDKLGRLFSGGRIEGENFEDTLRDLAGYIVIFEILTSETRATDGAGD